MATQSRHCVPWWQPSPHVAVCWLPKCWLPKCVPSAAIAAMAGCGVGRHYSKFAGGFSNASTIHGHRSKMPHVWRQLRLARRCSPKNAAIRNRKKTAGRFVVVNAIGQVVAHGGGRKKSLSNPVLQFWAFWLGGGRVAGGAADHRRQMVQHRLAGALPPCAWAWPWAWGLWAQCLFWPSHFFKLYKAM